MYSSRGASKGLVTNYGEGGGGGLQSGEGVGATKRGGGHVKFLPYEKGGLKKL